MSKEINTERRFVLYIFFSLVVFVLLLRLFAMQVLEDKYRESAEANAIQKMTIFPDRGLIYDRNNKLIVYNEPIYDLIAVPRDVRLADTMAFCHLIGISKQDFKDKILNIRRVASEGTFLAQLSKQDYAKIQEKLNDFPGFYISKRTVRVYKTKGMANALGYIAEISPEKLKKDTNNYYKPGDYIGKSGLEASYENHLRGKKGIKHQLKNKFNQVVGSYQNGSLDAEAIAGENLQSSVDIELQEYGEALMQNKIGAIVAIEPATGEILSLVTAPSYNPNLLTGSDFKKNYSRISKNPDLLLFNRATQSAYPPGSTFKAVQALIGLQDGVLNDTLYLPCNQSLVKCHPHPYMTNPQLSIQYSCNPFYYQAFRKIVHQRGESFQNLQEGYTSWREKVMKFGFGRKLGVDIADEGSGSIPQVERFNRVYKNNWNYSNIYSLSIGQGEMGVTLLQMANEAAIIANRGYYYIPHLIKSIGKTGKPLEKYQVRYETGINKHHYETIIAGMSGAFRAGTVGPMAQQVNLYAGEICAKTGTVQNPHGEDHSTFIAFAPRENPRIAIAVYVENAGFGGIWAATIASLMMQKYLKDTIQKIPTWQVGKIESMEEMVFKKTFIQRELLRQDSIWRAEKRKTDSLKAIQRKKEEDLEDDNEINPQ
ncbi:MAG: penicillin-binding transpeptidase domain-containing protein [Thermonemataceae bacterium]|nr:penicillin-binding transpeptidase domain-containing protein [Thermonemataceae bacterium]